MKDIHKGKAKIWCDRLNHLMKERRYTQESFLKEYKSKYGGGTQANISRWLRVGNKINIGKKEQDEKIEKEIGFPSYESMLNIADFFGVTVGYLTGETDFETFDMEKACQTIGIDKETGKAMQSIVSGKSVRPFGKYQSKEISATMKFLLNAKSFPEFIKGLREYADNLYQKNYAISYMESAKKQIDKEIVDLAVQCMDYQYAYDDMYGGIDDFKDNNIEPSEKLLNTIQILQVARDKDFEKQQSKDYMVKLSEYELQKTYFELIKEVVSDEHLSEIAIRD